MNEGNSVEINLIDFFFFLRKKLWIIILAAALCGASVFCVCKFLITPQYIASTRVYILNRTSEGGVSYSEFQASNQFTKDYEVLITGVNVTKEVIKELDLDMTSRELAKKITITSPTDTRILQINVCDSDPEAAAEIANCVRRVAGEQVVKIMDIDAVNLIYEAEVPTVPSTPTTFRDTIVAAVLGVIVTGIILLIVYMLDDRLKTEDDVERYLHLNTVGTIPLSHGFDNTRVEQRKLSKKERYRRKFSRIRNEGDQHQ